VKRIVFVALVSCLALSVAPKVLAQGVGSVRGTVTDEKGAVVPGADVVITNTATAYSRSMTSDAGGNYGFQSLPIGQYVLRVKKGGFRDFELKEIVLHVNDALTLDAQLHVGGATETVEVTASTAQVELANGELSGTISGSQITDLPLNGRSFAQLVTLVPGVSTDSGFSYDKKGVNGGADISVSGAPSNGNLWLVDGANNVDVGSNRTILVYPSLDSIEEFKIVRNSYGAQFGGAGGGIVSIVSKSGTNAFHGSVYYFGRNDVLDAKDPVLNFLDPTSKKNAVRRNDFGGSIGGPIKKDKIFFFASEEWNREIRGVVRNAHVPTPLQRTGDFSDAATDPAFTTASTDGCLLKGGLVDPDPTSAGGAFTASSSTPGIIDVIPSARLSQAGSTILNTYFLPTLAPGQPNYGCGNNWAKTFSQPTYWREDSYRGDIKLSPTLSLMMKYTQDSWTFGPSAVGNSGWGADAGASNIQEAWSQPSRLAVGRLSKVFGNTAVNDFQFSYSANRINITQATPAAQQALNGVIPPFLSAPDVNNPPVWVNGGGLPTIWSFAPWNNREDLYSWQDDFSKVIRRHTLKIGASYSRNAKDQQNFSQKAGVTFGPVGYNGCTTTTQAGCTNLADFTSHYGPADYIMQNMAVNWGEQNVIFPKQGRWENFELYFNDDLKLNNRLTVNLGVRYSYLPWPYQANDQFTVFNQAAFNPALGNAPCNGLYYSAGLISNPCPAQFDTGNKDSSGNEIFVPGGGLAGPNRAIQNNYNRAIAPRFGLAWDPTGSAKWAIRGGFGVFYNRDDIFVTDGTAGVNPPFIASFKSVSGNGRLLDNTNQLAACTPNCFGSGLGNASIGQDLNSRAPYTLQYNLTIQRELRRDTILEVGYVGSQTRNWTTNYDANAVAPVNRLAFAQSNGTPAARALYKPFDVIQSGTISMYSHRGSSQYDSLQVGFKTRFQRNSIFQATYTESKTFSDTSLHISNGGGNRIVDPFDLRSSYGLATINRPHIFTANLIYNLPTFQSMQRMIRSVLGGWEVGTGVNIASGTSYTPTISGLSNVTDPAGIGNGGGTGSGATRPNLVPGQPCKNPNFSPHSDLHWVNPNRYTMNDFTLGTIGNAPVGDCLGPPTRLVDFSVGKSFNITERVKMQFRMDFFNLFNHPNYGSLGDTAGLVPIGFNAVNTAASPEFLDANGAPSTTLANAVTVQNTTPASGIAQVSTQADRNRELQYSLRFTF